MDGVSYVVAADKAMDAMPLLELLGRELGIKRLLVEGGGNVNGSMMAAGVVDELSILLAPRSTARSASPAPSRSRTRAASRARRASDSRRTRRSSTASCTFVTPSSRRSRLEDKASSLRAPHF